MHKTKTHVKDESTMVLIGMIEYCDNIIFKGTVSRECFFTYTVQLVVHKAPPSLKNISTRTEDLFRPTLAACEYTILLLLLLLLRKQYPDFH